MSIDIRKMIWMLGVVAGVAFGAWGCSVDKITIPEEKPITIILESQYNGTVHVGSTTEVAIKCKGFPDSVYGLTLRISFDSDLVAINENTSFVPGDLLDPNAVTLFQVEGSALHLASIVPSSDEPFAPSGLLGKVTVMGRSPGNCTFAVEEDFFRLVNIEGEDLDVSSAVIVSDEVKVY